MAISRRIRPQVEKLLSDMLDEQEIEVFVVRPATCEALYMNKSAMQHLGFSNTANTDCRKGFCTLFRGICSKCPGGKVEMDAEADKSEDAEKKAEPEKKKDAFSSFDIQDDEGRIYSANCKMITWLDNKPAAVWFLQNMDELRHVEKELFHLAYFDQLTSIPNRQKLRKDFEDMEAAIKAGRMRGILALLDLDNFKQVNDTYGHNTGDIMLQRLTEHFENDPAFEGHIYRLGGDEFVLLFAETKNDLSDEQFLAKYESILRPTMRSYTLPNIDMSCTISMGVSQFPLHGYKFSEVLRKADIALYQSKENGRNNLCFFQDKYDAAKKLKDVYINIQPILTGKGRTYGYELIDQGSNDDHQDKDVSLGRFNRATDALGLEDIENDTYYFISYTNQLHNATVRWNLPKDKFIISMRLPDTVSGDYLKTLHKLSAYGYKLAFSNLTASNATPAVIQAGDYFKVPLDAVTDRIEGYMKLHGRNKKFIAMDINTTQAFQQAQKKGFTLFQGYYFKQPAVTEVTKQIDPLKINYYRLLKLTSTGGYVDFKEISDIISSDLAMSYKLLRLLNSAAVGLRYKVSSIVNAVVYLGEENLKKWIALMALRGVCADKPAEIMRISMIRAQFGELLAPHLRPRRNAKHAFLTGMFSLLHVALDKSKEQLLAEMPIAEDIEESLLTNYGPYSDLISFFVNYEYANWDEVNRFGELNSVSGQTINDCYVNAVKWYNDLMKE